jgi:hygromycin-B 7''-O-kinase
VAVASSLAAAWPAIPRPHRARVVSEVGEMLTALHGLDPDHCTRSSARQTGPAFSPASATAAERQRAVELPELWLSQIEGFLESAPLMPGRERVLLHTEVIREHLVVTPGPWTLSGLLDFETAMTGDRAYEFAAAGLLISRGDPSLLGRILAGYGRSFDPRELLAYTLLHVHSNLPECLSELPAPPESTLDSLALTWFGTT